MKIEIKIEGLSCGHCVNAVSTILKELHGISNFSVSLPNLAIVEFDVEIVGIDMIKQAINDSEIYKAT